MSRREYGCIARWLDGKPWVMRGVLAASIGSIVGAFYVWEDTKLGSILLAAVGFTGGSLVLRGKILP